MEKFSIVESAAGYRFRDPALIRQALSHSSFAEEKLGGRINSNERMEFLGDAILGFLLAKMLYRMFPGQEEGVLARLRAHWVSTATLADIAERAGVKEALELGAGEGKFGGSDKPRNLAGALEAVTAALYIDGGMRAAEKFVSRYWKERVKAEGTGVLLLDSKTRLQELIQKMFRDVPSYATERAGSLFTAAVSFRGRELGAGKGPSKKQAEQEAAARALENDIFMNKKVR